MRIAAKVAQEKEAHPERFCRVRRCLWRVETRDGFRPCEKHPPIKTYPVTRSDGRVVYVTIPNK